MKKVIAVSMACLMAVFSVGCSTTNVISALNGVVIATEIAGVAVPVLCGAGGIPAAACAPIESYIGATAKAASAAAIELKSSDANSIKISTIASIFASVAIPLIPADADPRIAAYVQGISAAISTFLNLLGVTHGEIRALPKTTAGQVIEPGFFERRELGRIQARADLVAKKIGK